MFTKIRALFRRKQQPQQAPQSTAALVAKAAKEQQTGQIYRKFVRELFVAQQAQLNARLLEHPNARYQLAAQADRFYTRLDCKCLLAGAEVGSSDALLGHKELMLELFQSVTEPHDQTEETLFISHDELFAV